MLALLRPLFSWALLVAAIAGTIYPAFIDGPSGKPPQGVSQTIIELFLHPDWTLNYFLRMLCLFVAGCIGYIIVITYRYNKVPMTAVRTKVEVKFSPDFSRAEVAREQTLRANQPNVTAHFSTVKPTTPTGVVPEASIQMDAYCHGCSLASDFHLTGSEKSGFDIIHEFGREMPYSWYMPLIPHWLLNKSPDEMFGFVRKCLVIRNAQYVYSNEYNVLRPTLMFTASNYPQLNVSIKLIFEGGPPPNIKVNRVKSTGVVRYEPSRDKGSVNIFLERMQNETCRVSW